MFDDLRQQANEGDFGPEESGEDFGRVGRSHGPIDQNIIFGLTPMQRLFLAFMLLILTCVLGMSLLLVTEKIVPPFLY